MNGQAKRRSRFVREAALGADARWRAVVEHAPDGILLTIPDGRIIGANPAACTLLGRTEAEICAGGRADVVVPDEALSRLLEERKRHGRARGVVTMRRGDGTTFLADIASTVFESDTGELWTSMSFGDVTQIERARHALEILADAGRVLASSLDLPTTLRQLTDLVVPRLADVCTVDLVEPDGVVRAAVAHRDPTRVAAFEQVRRRKMHPDATDGVDYVLRTGKPSYVFELTDEWLRAMALDPAHFEQALALGVRSFVSVPLIAHGVTIGALTLMSDGGVPSFGEDDLELAQALGERAAMAIDNAHRHAEVLAARRLRDEVLAVVAHDLRGPLYVIQLAAMDLERQQASNEVTTIRRAVRRADALIRDLLLASKAEGGNLQFERRSASLTTMFEEVSALHLPLAEAASLRFSADIEGKVPNLEVDPHRIVQMLSNLVANALKFTPAGGRVELRGRVEAGAS